MKIAVEEAAAADAATGTTPDVAVSTVTSQLGMGDVEWTEGRISDNHFAETDDRSDNDPAPPPGADRFHIIVDLWRVRYSREGRITNVVFHELTHVRLFRIGICKRKYGKAGAHHDDGTKFRTAFFDRVDTVEEYLRARSATLRRFERLVYDQKGAKDYNAAVIAAAGAAKNPEK